MEIALIKDNYKIIFNNEHILYKVLITLGGYHQLTYEEFETILYESNTRICYVNEDGSLKDYYNEVNNNYYCIWNEELNKMSLYENINKENKFIKDIDLMANIKIVAKFNKEMNI